MHSCMASPSLTHGRTLAILSACSPRTLLTAPMNSATSASDASTGAYSPTGSRFAAASYVFSAPAIGAKAGRLMSSKINYTKGPIRKIKVLADFLPRPEERPAVPADDPRTPRRLHQRLQHSRHEAPYFGAPQLTFAASNGSGPMPRVVVGRCRQPATAHRPYDARAPATSEGGSRKPRGLSA